MKTTHLVTVISPRQLLLRHDDHMVMGHRLGAALEEVYRVFGAQPKPLEIDACPCCVDADQVRVLLTTPLREIGADQLSSYASSAFLTVGEEADFRYFLPRILDISLNDRSW